MSCTICFWLLAAQQKYSIGMAKGVISVQKGWYQWIFFCNWLYKVDWMMLLGQGMLRCKKWSPELLHFTVPSVHCWPSCLVAYGPSMVWVKAQNWLYLVCFSVALSSDTKHHTPSIFHMLTHGGGWGCNSVGRASDWHVADTGSIPWGGKGFFS